MADDDVIAVIPPASFFSTGRRNLLINGSAGGPSTGSPPGSLPVAPVGTPCLVLPRFGDDMSLWNTEGPGGDQLVVSFGTGTGEIALDGVATIVNNATEFLDVGTNLIYLRGDNGAGLQA